MATCLSSASVAAMPLATPTRPPQDDLAEPERVRAWRISRLLAAGYCDEDAVDIACSTVDLHDAVALVERGCPPELARLILL